MKKIRHSFYISKTPCVCCSRLKQKQNSDEKSKYERNSSVPISVEKNSFVYVDKEFDSSC